MPRSPIVFAVRARRTFARPRVRRVTVVALAVATGLLVAALVGAAERARDRWGATRRVAVATRDLVVGDVVGADDVAVRELPVAAVAGAALDRAPLGAVVRDPVPAGEPLVAARLAPLGLRGAAALVPSGHRGVAIALGPAGAPPLGVGDHVDVLDLTAPAHASSAIPAVVVAVSDEVVTVAVATEDAGHVASLATQGLAALALAGT